MKDLVIEEPKEGQGMKVVILLIILYCFYVKFLS